MTDISALGEFGLIEHLTRDFQGKQASVLKGIGDDAAVVADGEEVQVFSTDLLLEGIHFDLAYFPLRHLGYKAVAVNLSDIAAMNALPYGITVSIGMSNRFTVEALDELYAGIRMACEKYGVDLLGGDTSSSKQGLIISVTAFGKTGKDQVSYRSGAQPKDLICVSGDVGGAYAGFLILDREKSVFLENPELQPDLTDFDYVIGRQLKPEARTDVVLKLREWGIVPTAMIDVSDGIGSELHHISRQSGTGATIYADKLPIDFQTVSVAETFQISPTTFALNGGEDYELLFTVPLSAFDVLKTEPGITVIGHVTEEKGQVQVVLGNGTVTDVPASGWNHFPDKKEKPE
ncbi:MAG: thiamine-phosphate kinase [Bacteroidota bacterium]